MPDLVPGVPSALSPLVRRIVAPNITPDAETGAGRWTDDMLARAMQKAAEDDDIRLGAVDDALLEAALLVMHPHIAFRMQREIVLPEAARERVADHHDGGLASSAFHEITAALELRVDRHCGRRGAVGAEIDPRFATARQACD